MEVEARIEKDIKLFYENLGKVSSVKEEKAIKVIELSKMYASDSQSFLKKKDLHTAFSCISYAHGLLDAIIKMNEK